MLQLCGPTAIAAIVGYSYVIWWHARQSRLTIESLSTQLNDDDYGMPASRWQQLIVRATTAIGFILVLLVLLSAFHARN